MTQLKWCFASLTIMSPPDSSAIKLKLPRFCEIYHDYVVPVFDIYQDFSGLLFCHGKNYDSKKVLLSSMLFCLF